LSAQGHADREAGDHREDDAGDLADRLRDGVACGDDRAGEVAVAGNRRYLAEAASASAQITGR